MERALHGAAARASMATAAEFLSERGYVQFALASQTYAKPAVGKLPEKGRDFDVAYCQRVVHQAFTIFFSCSDALHLLLGRPYPGEWPLALQGRKRCAEQTYLRCGMTKVNIARTARRVGSREYQFPRQFKSGFGGPFKHERAGIREYPGVEAGRDFRRDLHPSLARQSINHFCRSDSLWVDPINVCESAAALVMVNVDQELLFQPFQSSTLNAIALQKNSGIVAPIHPFGLDYAACKRELLVHARHTVTQHDFCLLAHTMQDFAARQRRPDCVSIGTGV